MISWLHFGILVVGVSRGEASAMIHNNGQTAVWVVFNLGYGPGPRRSDFGPDRNGEIDPVVEAALTRDGVYARSEFG